MPRTEIATIVCPNCKNDLPAWSQSCQFCGNPLQGVVRPVGAAIVDTWTDRPTWQEVCYIIVSVIFILNGGFEILQGFKFISLDGSNISAGIGTYFQIMGAISAVLGIGMLFQQLWAQFLVKWYSVLALVVSLWNILLSATMAPAIGRAVPTSMIVLIVCMHVAYACFYGFTIYIIKVVGDVDP